MIFIACLPFDAVGLIWSIDLVQETQFRRGRSPQLAAVEENGPSEMVREKVSGAMRLSHATGHWKNDSVEIAPPMVPEKAYLPGLAVWTGSYSDKNILHHLGEIFVHLLTRQ
jgi:hypothetical protein